MKILYVRVIGNDLKKMYTETRGQKNSFLIINGPMSAIAKYLEHIRVEKNISLEESARRSNMTAESYLQKEQQPEKVPLYMLASMMTALDFSRDEFVEFSFLTSQHVRD